MTASAGSRVVPPALRSTLVDQMEMLARQRPTLDDGAVVRGVVGVVAPNKSRGRATDANVGEVRVDADRD